jgi:hypothetical protein
MAKAVIPKKEGPAFKAALIREASREGRLIAESEIRSRLAEKGLAPVNGEDGWTETDGAEGVGDVAELQTDGGDRYYYSSESMTETYALLLLRKKIDRTRLIAEVVRESCAAYPKPVPLDLFADPPFDLAVEDVTRELERMRDNSGYEDIARTLTSTGRVFLYSTLHLEPDHAAMLAEWIDVGQLNNP